MTILLLKLQPPRNPRYILFDKGLSEIGTTSLQRALPISPKLQMQYISTSEMRTASLQGTEWLIPKCPLLIGPLYNCTGLQSAPAQNSNVFFVVLRKCICCQPQCLRFNSPSSLGYAFFRERMPSMLVNGLSCYHPCWLIIKMAYLLLNNIISCKKQTRVRCFLFPCSLILHYKPHDVRQRATEKYTMTDQ